MRDPALELVPDAPLPACRFGRFELEPEERRLLADGKPLQLGARAFDLLVAMVARAGRLVSKNELLTLVWPGLVVEENNLQVQMSTLRKILGTSALATIPGRGYRFLLPVERVGTDDAALPSSGLAAAGTPVASPPSASVPPSTHAGEIRLPRAPLLYGREADIEAISTLLARSTVLTITGPGGIGKTRIAQALVARATLENAAEFPDGVWWVELAPLTDGALVAAAVARVLDTQLGADRPPVDTIAAVLAPLRLLLVLDNCEHLAAAVAAFVDTVCTAAPGVRVLVTSQETLKTTGEHVYRLGSLAVPDAGGDASQAGAVELFVARAQAVDPRFALTDTNTPAVVEICRRLDGIPLAIELAAARVPLLGVEGLRTRLGERFNVLTAGARVALRRHQTLRAMLEWSHGHLTQAEQTVFRRLGVFAGSFTLEAAQHVVQDAQIDAWSALDLLGALVDKSLVLAEGDPVPRYRLLETTRAYALERLGEAGETEFTLRLHAQALLQLLTVFEREDQDTRVSGAGAQAAAAELDNLRAALTWAALAPEGGALAIALAGHATRVWSSSSQWSEGMERSLGLRKFLHDELPTSDVARFWLTLAQLGLYSTRRESFDAARRAAELYRELGDQGRLFDALIVGIGQGVRFGTLSDMAEAVAEADGLVTPEWPGWRRARLEFARGRWFVRQGRWEEYLAAAQRQAAICKEIGNEISMHYAMSNVTSAEIQLGQVELALAHARNSIVRLDVIGGGAGAGHLWLQVQIAEALLGRIDAAYAAGRTAYALLLREGDELAVFWGLALCAARRGRLADAARIIGYAEGVDARSGIVVENHYTCISDALDPILDAGLTEEERRRLQAEGAAMPEARAVRLALGDEV